jgi:ATP-dependent helicase/nuclease subunit B
MRAAFGLPGPDRRIGLAAHDVAQALAGPEVAITRADKAEGAPTVPSRWLLRLDAVLQASGADRPEAPALPADPAWPAWAAELDRPDAVRPIDPPAPRPPAEARPARLSVTQIGVLFSDPYEIYARKVLGLEALDPIDADPGAADRGEIIHDTLAAFLAEIGDGPLPAEALDRLIAHGRARFAPFAAWPGVAAFWWPRFERVAAWFVATEAARREAGTRPVLLEGTGRMPVGDGFTLTARADRIDREAAGALTLIDYKTGRPPTPSQVAAGFAPQLPLEALIARAGGFQGLGPAEVAAMQYWWLSGSHDPGRIQPIDKGRGQDLTPDEIIARTAEGLTRLVAAFADPRTPYLARPNPFNAPRFSDYGHLARVDEWAGGEGGDG